MRALGGILDRVDELRESLTFVAALRTHNLTRQQCARAADTGDLVRIARGVYAPRVRWDACTDTERYRAVIYAVAETRRTPPIVSHWSAAALHGLPMVGRWPSTVHIAVPPGLGTRSRNHIARHSMFVDQDDVVEIAGLRVTSLARTVVDLAACVPFPTAVAIADHALHVERLGLARPLCTRDELNVQWERRVRFSGWAKAREVVDFATEHSDSVLESVSRATMELLGLPRPQLQVPFADHRGLVGYADFYWPELSLVGEADGDGKYLDPQLRGARSVEQVLLDQSKRENRLRALGNRVTRWDWATATSPSDFRRHLASAGLFAQARSPRQTQGPSSR